MPRFVTLFFVRFFVPKLGPVREIGERVDTLRPTERFPVPLPLDTLMLFVVRISSWHTGQIARSFGAPKPLICATGTEYSTPFCGHFGFTHFARRFIIPSLIVRLGVKRY
jgi:hypothetical protein